MKMKIISEFLFYHAHDVVLFDDPADGTSFIYRITKLYGVSL